ncbi:LOW QUALITY PROTEIN: WD repeat-containing protein 49-like [Zalophus californianus]|uniref:LOW QUALITY PROTEIN: WD repeat-containing protein 49-like n=1 Tax=Zalophus californianus TaxID=9704 RepID=A0A6J2CUZ3_ZALCA|nr:LOW QUALITY PROTEIN: WD repeat-containing protein 49-like [Zalophus californianus]
MGTTNVKQKMKETRAVRKDVEARREQAFLSLPQRRAECDQTVFRTCKGVKAFSFCKRKNLPLTGGMDRIIRVWNPYLPGKPTGMLKSHTAPMIYIHVSAEDNKIFSMSTDNIIKIWDLETDSCLFTASSKASGIKGEFTACLYLPHSRALCVATDTAALPHLRLRSPPEPYLVVSHQEPMVCCRYNPAFWQVVNCSEASVVKVWDFETGRLLSGFIGAHGNAGITCLTFDISGRRLITGGRDGCLKIWSYSNGHCLHTLQHDEKENEVCDCTYLEMNQHKYIIAVGWDKRINVYFDAPCDFHHFWKPQPHWQDDLNRGHKEDILCVAQCPPFLLATSSYDGEVIIWNVIPGHIYCKLNTSSPSDGAEDRKSPNRSVSCLTFLKTRAAKFESVAASLIANRPRGSVAFWRLCGGACSIANFSPSRDKAQVSSIAVTAGDALAYVADRKGFVHIYDIKEYGLQGPELQSPKSVTFWRAHVSVVISLELIEEKLLLSSSLDRTVCLWSRGGEYIGTFGQHSSWDIFTPASWSHPRVPYEILTDPQSMPAYPVLEGNVAAMHTEVEEQDNVVEEKAKFGPDSASLDLVPTRKIHVTDKLSLFPNTSMIMGSHSRNCSFFFQPEKTPNPCSPEDPILEAEMKEDIDRWCAFRNGRIKKDVKLPRRSTDHIAVSVSGLCRGQVAIVLANSSSPVNLDV